jgi:hypothetical protein
VVYTPITHLWDGRAFVFVPGLPQVHVDAARRMLADDEKLEAWAATEREHQKEMAVISIVPEFIWSSISSPASPPPAQLNELAYASDKTAA